jgi:hypothetical protein
MGVWLRNFSREVPLHFVQIHTDPPLEPFDLGKAGLRILRPSQLSFDIQRHTLCASAHASGSDRDCVLASDQASKRVVLCL